jgi:hypothetical protein
VFRPSSPAFRDAGNSEQSLDLASISSVDAKYVLNRQSVIRSFDYPDLISSGDRALNDDSQVRPGSQRFGKSPRKHLIVHSNPKPPARDPWLGYFKDGGTDLPALADERVVHRDSFRREVFAKLAVLKRATELPLPPSRIFDRVCVNRFIRSPVCFTIGLVVSFEIDASGRDTAGNRQFPNRALGRPTVIIKLARPSNID